MTPTLVLYRGSLALQLIPIPGRVARIGSDPGCDLRLDAAPPLLATVERQADRCLLHVRSEQPMRLNRRGVTAGQPSPWPIGGRLRIDRERVIVLIADEAAGPDDEPARPAGGSSPADTPGPGVQAEAAGTAGSLAERHRRRSRVQLLVTLVLLALAGWSAWGLDRPSPRALQAVSEAPSDGFSTLIGDVRSVGDEGRIAAQEFQLALQEGRQGEGVRARARLIRLRSWLRQFADAEAQFTGRFRPLGRMYQIIVKLI